MGGISQDRLLTVADHPGARRLLFLLPFAPRLDATNGGSRVMAQVIGALASRHRIALLYFRAADEPPIEEILLQRCEVAEEVRRPVAGQSVAQRWLWRVRYILGFLCGKPTWATDWMATEYSHRARDLARRWQPDLIQIEYHIMGQYLSALNRCPAPRVLVEHEAAGRAARDRWQFQRGVKQLLAPVELRAWRKLEQTIFRRVQAIVVFTEHDHQVVAAWAGRTPVVRIPLGTVLPEHPLSHAGHAPWNLLYVGNFAHPPNVDAAMRLIGSIFPRVHMKHPELSLHIVGDQPPSQLRQMAMGPVVVTGFVPDVTPYLDRAAVVVVPLRQGGGMRVKVLEALAAGKAVVASSLAVEGLSLVDGEQVVLAETDQQFADAIGELLIDPQRRVALGTRARAWACEHLGWDTSIAAYESLYQRLLVLSASAYIDL